MNKKYTTYYEEVDFIKNHLFKLCKQFKGIKIDYAYDSSSEFHIIEVSPETIRKNNKKYKELERKLFKDFIKNFNDSDILICEPSSSNEMSNLIFSN